jgi:3-deoxy-D-manno-octulosonate 8-phosphate phosphatase (KDO 8-P phosphatase)
MNHPSSDGPPAGLSRDASRRLAAIRLLLLDVDGVLTDGGLYYGSDHEEWKRLDAKDGAGLVIARMNGLESGIITGKSSAIVAKRAEEFGMTRVVQGALDKVPALETLLADGAYTLNEVAFMGDDVLDLPVLRRVGFAACPADAHASVRARAHFVCTRAGGRGAVRELVDLWLQVQGKLDAVADLFWDGPGLAGHHAAGTRSPVGTRNPVGTRR